MRIWSLPGVSGSLHSLFTGRYLLKFPARKYISVLTAVSDAPDKSNTARDTGLSTDTTSPQVSNDPNTSPVRSHKSWTVKDMKTLKENTHLPMAALCELLPGKSYDTIRDTLLQIRFDEGRDVQLWNRVKWLKDDLVRIAELHQKNTPLSEICAEFPNRSVQSLKCAMRRAGYRIAAENSGRHNRRWTAGEVHLYRELAKQGVGKTEISRTLNRTLTSVEKKGRALSIKGTRRDYTPEEDGKLRQWTEDGATKAEMVAELGRSLSSVNRRLISLGSLKVRETNHDGNTYKFVRGTRGILPSKLFEIESQFKAGVAWPVIAEKHYRGSHPADARRLFYRQVKKRDGEPLVSAAEHSRIRRWRREGKTWPEIGRLGDFALCHQNLQVWYNGEEAKLEAKAHSTT